MEGEMWKQHAKIQTWDDGIEPSTLSVGLNRVALVMWALATHNNKLGKGVHATKGGCEGERGNTL